MSFLIRTVPAVLALAALQIPAFAAGSADAGRALYQARCAACHSLDYNGVGPAHRGVFGRPAAQAPGYAYSDALRATRHVWNEDTLNRWLSDPEKFAPGQRMGVNVPDAQDRADLIAYLKQASPPRNKAVADGMNADSHGYGKTGLQGTRTRASHSHPNILGNMTMQRRDFLALSAAGGGAVFASGLAGCAALGSGMSAPASDFYFVQLSDTHWGYQGPANPEANVTLRKSVAAVNALSTPPDFIVFTGDLTHTTDDPAERRRRLAEFKTIVADLKVKTVRFMPGEHDASLDRGAAFQEAFGATHYSFDHKGVHFIALDNVSDPGAKIGDEQLAWLATDLAPLDKQAPIVVLTHRPLFDLAPKWDWATRDGAQALDLLMPHANVTVFYGHIHQEHHQMTGHIAHHSAKSLVFPLSAPGSQDKRTPLPWDPSAPFKGLGFREVEAQHAGQTYHLAELPVTGA